MYIIYWTLIKNIMYIYLHCVKIESKTFWLKFYSENKLIIYISRNVLKKKYGKIDKKYKINIFFNFL